MNKGFYARLACSNIRNNKTIYLPYLLASTLIVTLFYGLRSVSFMLLQSEAKGAASMAMILDMSSWICGVLALIILFYINGFIMKRRKKEFGLYSILGMEKRHLSRVMIWEVLMTGACSLLFGILGGALFSQLAFLLLLNIVGLPVSLTFQIPCNAVAVTGLLFGAGFVLLLLYDILSICRTDPIALLRSPNEGEREPKSKWLIALLGLFTLGGGYVLAWMVKTPSDALGIFFPAVLLVIIGTYCLFMSGSIVFLKGLRRNKGFYYKPKNFVAVSGMMYRMKQNATGLSNICILSACVLATLSSTVCLFIGEEDILRTQYPKEVKTSCIMTDAESGAVLEQASQAHAAVYGITTENETGYLDFDYPANRTANRFDGTKLYNSETYDVNLILLADYNRLTGSQVALKKGEVLMAIEGDAVGNTVDLNGRIYAVKRQIELPSFVQNIRMGRTAVIVLPQFSDVEEVQTLVNLVTSEEDGIYVINYYYDFDVVGTPDNLETYYSTMRADLLKSVDRLASVSNVDGARSSFYQLYGTLLFVGIFCVALFLISAVLIMYYKQITEGFDDHDRFRIMQNVGMSDGEVRATISKQVLMVFFLPLGVAIIHIAMAFPVLCKLLRAFNMENQPLFLGCTIGAILAFALFYFAVYRLTSRTYYRIVQA